MIKLVTDNNWKLVIGGAYPHICANDNKYEETAEQKAKRSERDKIRSITRYESKRR